MIAALLVIAAVLVSALVVRIGAVAFEMTGLEKEKAGFQALSCFSGTGFTSREAELRCGSPLQAPDRGGSHDLWQRGTGYSSHHFRRLGQRRCRRLADMLRATEGNTKALEGQSSREDA